MRYIWLIPLLPGHRRRDQRPRRHPLVLAQDAPALVACAMMTAALGAVAVRVLAAARAAGRRARLRRHRRRLDSARFRCETQRRHRPVPGALGVPARSAVRDDDARRHRHRHADPRLLDRLHGRRAARRRRALLLLPEPVLLLHAHARPGKQLPGDVRGLGRRRPLLVPADRLLVREEERGGRRQEGVHHQPHRRLGLRPRRLPDLLHVRHARLPRRAERRGDDADRDGALRRAVVHLPAAVRRRDRQERADSALRLAAGRDGRADAGLGADPRGDDGHRGRLHARPQRRAVLARAAW